MQYEVLLYVLSHKQFMTSGTRYYLRHEATAATTLSVQTVH